VNSKSWLLEPRLMLTTFFIQCLLGAPALVLLRR